MMGPYKCPECGVWWAGLEHRCRPPMTTDGANWPSSITWPTFIPTFTVRCTCPPKRGDSYAGNCPIHDVQTTYTVRA